MVHTSNSISRVGIRKRERQRETERERERQTERDRERQRDRETERVRERDREKEKREHFNPTSGSFAVHTSTQSSLEPRCENLSHKELNFPGD